MVVGFLWELGYVRQLPFSVIYSVKSSTIWKDWQRMSLIVLGATFCLNPSVCATWLNPRIVCFGIFTTYPSTLRVNLDSSFEADGMHTPNIPFGFLFSQVCCIQKAMIQLGNFHWRQTHFKRPGRLRLLQNMTFTAPIHNLLSSHTYIYRKCGLGWVNLHKRLSKQICP